MRKTGKLFLLFFLLFFLSTCISFLINFILLIFARPLSTSCLLGLIAIYWFTYLFILFIMLTRYTFACSVTTANPLIGSSSDCLKGLILINDFIFHYASKCYNWVQYAINILCTHILWKYTCLKSDCGWYLGGWGGGHIMWLKIYFQKQSRAVIRKQLCSRIILTWKDIILTILSEETFILRIT